MTKEEKWFDDNIDRIIEAYQEENPEVVVNNGDPQDYLDMEELFDWAIDNLYVEKEEHKCCLCGEDFSGYGNNPWPLDKEENHRCCDDCNFKYVVPARLMNIKGE